MEVNFEKNKQKGRKKKVRKREEKGNEKEKANWARGKKHKCLIFSGYIF
jgi:hypothetical protein